VPGKPFDVLRAVSFAERPHPVGGELHKSNPYDAEELSFPVDFKGISRLCQTRLKAGGESARKEKGKQKACP
jgi:hypothetical protein